MAEEKPFEEVEELGPEKQFKRVPAKECYLNEIDCTERRVSVIVSVLSLNQEAKSALVSDSTAEAVVVCEDPEILRRIRKGAIMRIIANPSGTAPLTLSVEAAQELKDFDSNLFKKVKEEWGKLRQ